jgi:hypothetical protein
MKGIQVFQIKGQVLFKREIITKKIKMGGDHLKIFFSGTIRLTLTRLGTNHPWVKEIQIC